jgi:hypothetical protein
MIAYESDDGAWVLFMRGGKMLKRRPWCDCKKVRFGFTRRDDGAWVRPCCMRRTKESWEKFGDEPIHHDPLSCRWCRERVTNNGVPSMEEVLATSTNKE